MIACDELRPISCSGLVSIFNEMASKIDTSDEYIKNEVLTLRRECYSTAFYVFYDTSVKYFALGMHGNDPKRSQLVTNNILFDWHRMNRVVNEALSIGCSLDKSKLSSFKTMYSILSDYFFIKCKE
jgi:hypothetical protein